METRASARELVCLLPLLIMTPAIASAQAPNPDNAMRTVSLNSTGATVVISLAEFKSGRNLFNTKCSGCHNGGTTKTSTDSRTLSPKDLGGATPPRNTVEGLIDYMNNPTSYDGATEISEIHPSTKSSDIFEQMRDLRDEDLKSIAGYILTMPNAIGSKWGNLNVTIEKQ